MMLVGIEGLGVRFWRICNWWKWVEL